jgi:plasmid maintenance system antidote protein VapI
MALRLSRVLGRSAESWLAMQDSYDLWQDGGLGSLARQ